MNRYLDGSLKRLCDIVLSIILIPVVFVLTLLGAIAICITDGGPMFYTQPRVGRNSTIFTIIKLRTLRVGTTDDFAGMRISDPDSFFIGRILRTWRIDELPQIWNILKGEMSWVGPRPERPHIVARCEVEIQDYNLRHQILPGITGLAQIKMPDATPNDNKEKLLFDLKYSESASFWLDLKILLQTFRIIYTK